MISGLLFFGCIIAVHFIVKWRDEQNVDRAPGIFTGGGLEEAVNKGTEKRRSDKRYKLDSEVRKLNSENTDRIFYRDGPRIREYSPEKVALIRKCKRMNAPCTPGYIHYRLMNIDYAAVDFDEGNVNHYKCEVRVFELNQDFDNDFICKYDRHKRKIYDVLTGDVIPFDPDNYTLPKEYSI